MASKSTPHCAVRATGALGQALNLFSVRLFGVLLDGLAGAPVVGWTLWLYAALLLVSHALFYLQNDPEQHLMYGIRHQLKLDALAKMASIYYLAWQKLGTGMLIERIGVGSTASFEISLCSHLRLMSEILPRWGFA